MPVMTDEGAEAVQAGTETEPEITDDTEVVTTAEDGVEPDGAEDGAVPDSPRLPPPHRVGGSRICLSRRSRRPSRCCWR